MDENFIPLETREREREKKNTKYLSNSEKLKSLRKVEYFDNLF